MYLDAKLNLIQEENAYLFFNPVNESIARWFSLQTFEHTTILRSIETSWKIV